MAQRPNGLLIGIDSLRADAVFGNRIETPNLKALGDAGSAFTQCISTGALTTPAFAAILTGCFPPRNGVRRLRRNQLSADVSPLAEMLTEQGYTTIAMPTGPLLPATGIFKGFQSVDFRDGYNAKFFGWRDPLLARIEKLEEPWFVFLHTFEVHTPYMTPPDFRERWDKKGYEDAVAHHDTWIAPVLEVGGDNTVVVVTGDHGETYAESKGQRSAQIVSKFVRRRAHTRRWWRSLDRKLAPMALGHGYSLEEDLLRVPLLMKGPGIPTAVVDHQVRHVDITPTILDVCGVDPTTTLDGRSLLPVMNGEADDEETAYAELGVSDEGTGTVAVRAGGYKLLRMRDGELRLHRIADVYKGDGVSRPDPSENLIASQPSVADELKREMDRILESRSDVGSGMSQDEEEEVERHLRSLGYL